MDVLRQAGTSETGRVNQKRRTRAAIVRAATELLDTGVTPTVAQAAEAALVSRTTAYRYFPTQEALLLEVAITLDVEEIEALVSAPPDGRDPADRVLRVVERLNRHVLDDEVRYRTVMRLYHDLWLQAVAAGEEAPVVREGRRRRWIESSLAPLRGSVDAAAFDRLVAALSLVVGGEAVTVLRDVCQLDGDAAVDVTTWAAGALLRATLDGAGP